MEAASSECGKTPPLVFRHRSRTKLISTDMISMRLSHTISPEQTSSRERKGAFHLYLQPVTEHPAFTLTCVFATASRDRSRFWTSHVSYSIHHVRIFICSYVKSNLMFALKCLWILTFLKKNNAILIVICIALIATYLILKSYRITAQLYFNYKFYG